jgi:hypothetical protein
MLAGFIPAEDWWANNRDKRLAMGESVPNLNSRMAWLDATRVL